ncbi:MULTISPECIES: hypothetical protein [Marinobacter]|uniref:hypothetical protein n=1 Tax=Marinobacter TaxID=2742 RepID=UPI001486806B|nr:hypothetical protein [Marinobacter alexandrii]
MSDKNFQDLAEEEREAFQEHMNGPYDSEQRASWEGKRNKLVDRFWGEAGGNHDQD